MMRAVTAGILFRDGRYLICRRPAGKREGLKWEFPGGKVEPGESPEQCLVRELKEELDFTASVGRIYDARFTGDEQEFLILYYLVRIMEGEPRCMEHAEIRYVLPGELNEYDYPGADRAVAERLSREE